MLRCSLGLRYHGSSCRDYNSLYVLTAWTQYRPLKGNAGLAVAKMKCLELFTHCTDLIGLRIGSSNVIMVKYSLFFFFGKITFKITVLKAKWKKITTNTFEHFATCLALFPYVHSYLSPCLALLNDEWWTLCHFLCGNPKVHSLGDLPWSENLEGLSKDSNTSPRTQSLCCTLCLARPDSMCFSWHEISVGGILPSISAQQSESLLSFANMSWKKKTKQKN